MVNGGWWMAIRAPRPVRTASRGDGLAAFLLGGNLRIKKRQDSESR
jgi:hypothetical protein